MVCCFPVLCAWFVSAVGGVFYKLAWCVGICRRKAHGFLFFWHECGKVLLCTFIKSKAPRACELWIHSQIFFDCFGHAGLLWCMIFLHPKNSISHMQNRVHFQEEFCTRLSSGSIHLLAANWKSLCAFVINWETVSTCSSKTEKTPNTLGNLFVNSLKHLLGRLLLLLLQPQLDKNSTTNLVCKCCCCKLDHDT